MTDDLTSIHTCHADCPRPLCVAQRTIATQQEAIDELVAGLAKLEAANDDVAAKRTQETYLSMLDNDKAHDQLLELDEARYEARALLSKHGERT